MRKCLHPSAFLAIFLPGSKLPVCGGGRGGHSREVNLVGQFAVLHGAPPQALGRCLKSAWVLMYETVDDPSRSSLSFSPRSSRPPLSRSRSEHLQVHVRTNRDSTAPFNIIITTVFNASE